MIKKSKAVKMIQTNNQKKMTTKDSVAGRRLRKINYSSNPRRKIKNPQLTPLQKIKRLLLVRFL